MVEQASVRPYTEADFRDNEMQRKTGSKTVLVLMAAALLLSPLAAGRACAAGNASQILERINPDIALTESGVKGRRTFGTGFAITESVAVMTYHQESSADVTLIFPGGAIRGRAQFYDPDHDLTFIKINPRDLAAVHAGPVRLAMSGLADLKPGLPVYFAGVLREEKPVPTIRPAALKDYAPRLQYREDDEGPVKSYHCHINVTVDLSNAPSGVKFGMSGGPVLIETSAGLAALGVTSTRTPDLRSASFVPAETIIDDYRNLYDAPLTKPVGTLSARLPKICSFDEDAVMASAPPAKQILPRRLAPIIPPSAAAAR